MKKSPPRFGEGMVYTDTGIDEPSRYANSLCKNVDPEVFFPDERMNPHRGDNQEVRFAKKICGECEHQTDCAAYAILRPYIVGVWGGTSTADRRRIRKEYGIQGFAEWEYDTGGEK